MKIRKSIVLCFIAGLFVVTRSFSQIPSYVPLNGLLAWYPLDGNGNDLSINANNAANYGATFTANRFGAANSAASFNGSTSYLSVATPSFVFSPTGSFSYSFWINKQTQPAAGIVLMTGNNIAGNFITLIQGGTVEQFGTNMQQSAWIWIQCPHTLNVWDHYVATYYAGVMSFYKNAVLQGTTNFTYSGALTANLPLYIGRGFSGGNFLGSIDDIGIWNRAINQQEINALYNSTTGIADVTSSSLISVSPNPFTSTIQIQKTAFNTDAEVFVYNILGKLVFTSYISKNNREVNLSGLTKGVYMIKVNNGQFHYTQRIVKE